MTNRKHEASQRKALDSFANFLVGSIGHLGGHMTALPISCKPC